MTSRNDHIMWSELFKLSKDRKTSYQRQLIGSIAAAILDLKISSQNPLPSSRVLAKQLGIARNTVVNAYQQLVDDGFLISCERSGYFVNEDILTGRVSSPQKGETELTDSGIDWSDKIKCHSSKQRNIEKPFDWSKYRYPFLYGQLDPETFPLHAWRDCCRQALSVSSIEYSVPDYYSQDDSLLIEQIQARILSRRGVWASPDQILVTMGAQNAIYILAKLLMDKQTRVGIENPGYVDARNIFAIKTDRLQALEVDQNGLIPGKAVNDCDLVYVTPSHQYPTTVTMDINRRLQLLQDAEKHDFFLIEDDYESEINFIDEPTPALKSLDKCNRVIYIGSLSKTLGPGLRLGYMVGPPELIREARALRRLIIRHPPVNNQRLVGLFLSMGHHDSLLNRLHETYRKRWQIMGDSLARYMPDSARIPAFGGTAFWVKGPENLDSIQLQLEAQKQGILIESGDIFFMQPEQHKNYFRLGFSSISENKIDEGLEKLCKIIHSMV